MTEDQHKRCSVCAEVKPLADANRDARRAASVAWYAKNKDSLKACPMFMLRGRLQARMKDDLKQIPEGYQVSLPI